MSMVEFAVPEPVATIWYCSVRAKVRDRLRDGADHRGADGAERVRGQQGSGAE